jgi:23S rRNA (guanosine2251-2'-O)-methyltransferase
MKTEILYGFHPVHEALAANRRTIVKLYVHLDRPRGRLEQIVQSAQSGRHAIEYVQAPQLNAIAGHRQHQGVAAVVTSYPFVAIDVMLDRAAAQPGRHFLLLLDGILDPHNLGALIRTALAVGVHGVVVPKDRAAAPTPAVSKTSAGALEHMLISQVTNLSRTVGFFKEQGMWIIGLDPTAAPSIYETDLTGAQALVIGGEQKGIRPLIRKNCDMLVRIPQIGRVGSLNASVAGAVVMYEAFRQRMRNDEWRMTSDE